MRGVVGDEIIVKGHHVGDPDRKGEIVEVGIDGEPPFRVRWDDTGHTTLFFPGSDAVVEHLGAAPNDDPRTTPSTPPQR